MEPLHIQDNKANEVKKKYLIILCVVAFIWLLVIGWLKFDLHQKDILTSDMALYPNILWNTNFHDKFLFSDILYDRYGYKTFLNEHFAPTLLVLAPPYQLLPHPLFLVFLQTLIPVVTALLIYLLAKKVLGKPGLAFFFSLLYLFHPSLVAATIDNVYGFHHDSLIMPLVVLAALLFESNRFCGFLISLIFLFGLKENIPIIGLIFGAELLFLKRDKKWGIAVMGMALIFIFSGLWLLPWLTGLSNHHAASVFEALKNLTVTGFFTDLKSFAYWLVLLPFLPAIFAPGLFILAVPDWAMYFLTGKLPFYHHVFFSLSIVTVAAVFGFKKALANQKLVDFCKKYRPVIIIGLLIVYLGGNAMVFKRYADLEKNSAGKI